MTRSGVQQRVRMAFMPLLDAAPLIVAARMGFASSEGIEIALERETSWATLRDRVAVGHLDAAHMLAPMPIASNLGLAPLAVRIVVPMALGFGGNTVTVSSALAGDLRGCGLPPVADAAATGAALRRIVRERRQSGKDKLTIGVVHTHSAHFYQVAYWLSAVGIDHVRDVDIVVVPPSLTAAALARRQIDAFCAGEPWGTVAAHDAGACILLTNESIWRSSPEKVLGVREAWYEEDRERTRALVRSVFRAAQWCDDPQNERELARVLAGQDALQLGGGLLTEALARRRAGDGGSTTGFLAFARQSATVPSLSHAAWFYSQMTRWRQAQFSRNGLDIAVTTYRPDIHGAALKALGAGLSVDDNKIEGAPGSPAGSNGDIPCLGPEMFFDGAVFDPDDVEGYLARLG